jgi:hypothetical protein
VELPVFLWVSRMKYTIDDKNGNELKRGSRLRKTFTDLGNIFIAGKAEERREEYSRKKKIRTALKLSKLAFFFMLLILNLVACWGLFYDFANPFASREQTFEKVKMDSEDFQKTYHFASSLLKKMSLGKPASLNKYWFKAVSQKKRQESGDILKSIKDIKEFWVEDVTAGINNGMGTVYTAKCRNQSGSGLSLTLLKENSGAYRLVSLKKCENQKTKI